MFSPLRITFSSTTLGEFTTLVALGRITTTETANSEIIKSLFKYRTIYRQTKEEDLWIPLQFLNEEINYYYRNETRKETFRSGYEMDSICNDIWGNSWTGSGLFYRLESSRQIYTILWK